ncbi:endonuclease VII domain-containing protein [Parvimonas sp. M20]|uniref:endonuclease VII domain-containing protein n=1 Tax=Parvimonas sp. M20 TaxID=3110693 RepID=UPI003FA6FDFD
MRKQFGGAERTPLEKLKPNTWYAQQRRREEYAHLLEAQGHKCAICAGDISEKGKAYMDHCHTSGKARGWLCSRCNSGLGFFRDSPELMAKAIEYVKK